VYVVEPGLIDVYVGRSSIDLIGAGSVTVTAAAGPVRKAFDGTVTVA